jgi:hypothetical protein
MMEFQGMPDYLVFEIDGTKMVFKWLCYNQSW